MGRPKHVWTRIEAACVLFSGLVSVNPGGYDHVAQPNVLYATGDTDEEGGTRIEVTYGPFAYSCCRDIAGPHLSHGHVPSTKTTSIEYSALHRFEGPTRQMAQNGAGFNVESGENDCRFT
jgi:hypothetical protein